MRKCKNGFINGYIAWRGQCESPKEFSIWSAISAIGTALGKETFHDLGHSIVYPNQYIILAGPSGTQKSSSAEPIIDIFRTAFPDYPVVEGKITMPRLLVELSDECKKSGQSRGYIFASELKVFTEANMSGSSLLGDMIHLYGCPKVFNYKTKTDGDYHINNCYVNLLACSTVDWMNSASLKDFLNSGWAPRIMFVHRTRTGARVCRTIRPADWADRMADLATDLQEIASIKSEYTFTDMAEALHQAWYADVNRFTFGDPSMDTYASRKQAHVIKLAMALRASEDNTPVIDERHIKLAIQMVEQLESGIQEVHSSVNSHNYGVWSDRIVAKLKHHGKISSMAMNNYFLKAMGPDLPKLLTQLKNDGIIRSEVIQAHTRTTTYWMLCDEN